MQNNPHVEKSEQKPNSMSQDVYDLWWLVHSHKNWMKSKIKDLKHADRGAGV